MSASRCWPSLGALALVLALAPGAMAAEQGAALRQNALTLTWPAAAGTSAGALGMSETRLRYWQDWKDENLAIKGALELRHAFSTTPLAGASLLTGTGGAQQQPFEVWGLAIDGATGTVTDRLRLDRLDLAWRWGEVDLALGRQPIGMGTSHFVGVLDVLAPFAPGALDATFRPGVDALRARTALGESGEAEVIAAGADPWGQGALLGRARTSMAGLDFEAVGGRFRQRAFGGLGWEGELGPLGLWGEAALFERRGGVERHRGGASGVAFSGVAGADWLMPWDVRLGTAYFYQDFGARRVEDLASVRLDAPYQEGWAFLGASRYGVLTLHKPLHPLVTASLSGMISLMDGSSLWQPRLSASVSDNADLGLYGWLGAGKSAPSPGVLGSEFGAMPSGAGLYARWFF